MNKRAEMFYSLPQLKGFGVDTMVIASRSAGLHGTGYLPYFSDYASLKVYRPYRNLMEMFLAPWLHYAKVHTLVREFDPARVIFFTAIWRNNHGLLYGFIYFKDGERS